MSWHKSASHRREVVETLQDDTCLHKARWHSAGCKSGAERWPNSQFDRVTLEVRTRVEGIGHARLTPLLSSARRQSFCRWELCSSAAAVEEAVRVGDQNDAIGDHDRGRAPASSQWDDTKLLSTA